MFFSLLCLFRLISSPPLRGEGLCPIGLPVAVRRTNPGGVSCSFSILKTRACDKISAKMAELFAHVKKKLYLCRRFFTANRYE